MLPSVVRVATGNRHKVEELQAILAGWPLDILAGADPYPPEDEPDYVGNARIKARHGRTVAEPGAWVIAEDSGIEVAGLDGRPGVHSARFGGDDPVGRLLEALAGVTGEGRRGRYVCELICLLPDGTELRGTGTLAGHVAEAAAGSEGFGYDPIFVPDGVTRTSAELSAQEKDAISHRGNALRALVPVLREVLAPDGPAVPQ